MTSTWNITAVKASNSHFGRWLCLFLQVKGKQPVPWGPQLLISWRQRAAFKNSRGIIADHFRKSWGPYRLLFGTFVGYLTILYQFIGYIASVNYMVIMNWEGCGLFEDTIPKFLWRNWRTPPEYEVTVSSCSIRCGCILSVLSSSIIIHIAIRLWATLTN
jgi:hypothetical protein